MRLTLNKPMMLWHPSSVYLGLAITIYTLSYFYFLGQKEVRIHFLSSQLEERHSIIAFYLYIAMMLGSFLVYFFSKRVKIVAKDIEPIPGVFWPLLIALLVINFVSAFQSGGDGPRSDLVEEAPILLMMSWSASVCPLGYIVYAKRIKLLPLIFLISLSILPVMGVGGFGAVLKPLLATLAVFVLSWSKVRAISFFVVCLIFVLVAEPIIFGGGFSGVSFLNVSYFDRLVSSSLLLGTEGDGSFFYGFRPDLIWESILPIARFSDFESVREVFNELYAFERFQMGFSFPVYPLAENVYQIGIILGFILFVAVWSTVLASLTYLLRDNRIFPGLYRVFYYALIVNIPFLIGSYTSSIFKTILISGFSVFFLAIFIGVWKLLIYISSDSVRSVPVLQG